MCGLSARGLMASGFFALTAAVIAAVAVRPELAANQLFATLSSLIVGGGLINAGNYFFGSSAGSTRKDDALAAMAARPPAQQAGTEISQDVH
jgi:hypothetical protein